MNCCWNSDFRKIQLLKEVWPTINYLFMEPEHWNLHSCCSISTMIVCKELDVSVSCPISEEAVPLQICGLCVDTACWFCILYLVCSSRWSMWLARSFGNQCSVITTTKAEGKTDWTAMKPLLVSKLKERIHCSLKFFVPGVCLPFTAGKVDLLWDVSFCSLWSAGEGRPLREAHFFSCFYFQEKEVEKGMRERWRDREQTAFGPEETQEWEQPITTLKICWKEFWEVAPPPSVGQGSRESKCLQG